MDERCYNANMKVLVRAIITGFGLSVGAFVFRKISAKYNLEPSPTPAPPPETSADGGVQQQPS